MVAWKSETSNKKSLTIAVCYISIIIVFSHHYKCIYTMMIWCNYKTSIEIKNLTFRPYAHKYQFGYILNHWRISCYLISLLGRNYNYPRQELHDPIIKFELSWFLAQNQICKWVLVLGQILQVTGIYVGLCSVDTELINLNLYNV